MTLKKMQASNLKDWQTVDITTLNEPEKYLKGCSELLEGYNWYFGFGTALGLYRDNGFIPGDSDIDINILVDKDIEPLILAFKA